MLTYEIGRRSAIRRCLILATTQLCLNLPLYIITVILTCDRNDPNFSRLPMIPSHAIRRSCRIEFCCTPISYFICCISFNFHSLLSSRVFYILITMSVQNADLTDTRDNFVMTPIPWWASPLCSEEEAREAPGLSPCWQANLPHSEEEVQEAFDLDRLQLTDTPE